LEIGSGGAGGSAAGGGAAAAAPLLDDEADAVADAVAGAGPDADDATVASGGAAAAGTAAASDAAAGGGPGGGAADASEGAAAVSVAVSLICEYDLQWRREPPSKPCQIDRTSEEEAVESVGVYAKRGRLNAPAHAMSVFVFYCWRSGHNTHRGTESVKAPNTTQHTDDGDGDGRHAHGTRTPLGTQTQTDRRADRDGPDDALTNTARGSGTENRGQDRK
jgi:hypothetical protein